MGESTSMQAFYLALSLLTIAFGPLNCQDLDAERLDQQKPRYACPEFNVNFDGDDIDYVHDVSSWHECGIMCNLVPACKFWTWNTETHRCKLSSSDYGLEYHSQAISGQTGCK
eukprot:TRINITY_DN9357_c0_g1_i1.p1 TRINITY_DN9357_c0_g1~~TRINITY_DN9357_c0_g1_i1.p1  ORF type:complete len:113 (-),score=20.07 TRINITY_DN9357_c0_g1_i1:121-459(-)